MKLSDSEFEPEQDECDLESCFSSSYIDHTPTVVTQSTVGLADKGRSDSEGSTSRSRVTARNRVVIDVTAAETEPSLNHCSGDIVSDPRDTKSESSAEPSKMKKKKFDAEDVSAGHDIKVSESTAASVQVTSITPGYHSFASAQIERHQEDEPSHDHQVNDTALVEEGNGLPDNNLTVSGLVNELFGRSSFTMAKGDSSKEEKSKELNRNDEGGEPLLFRNGKMASRSPRSTRASNEKEATHEEVRMMRS